MGPKQLHGKHRHIVNNERISTTNTYTWLQGKLFPETEKFIIATHDRVIVTKNYLKYCIIIKDPNAQDDKCRKCKQFSRTIDHIKGRCKLLVNLEYLEGHNIIAKIIHKVIVNAYDIRKTIYRTTSTQQQLPSKMIMGISPIRRPHNLY